LETPASLKRFSLVFFKDVAVIYDCLTRLKNVDCNPSGFSLEDAPFLGLFVRIAKRFKEVLAYYEKDNAEIIGILERPMLEASAVATYLMRHGPDVMLDYRKCSYKDRLRIFRDLEADSAFFRTQPGQRVLKSVRETMQAEGLMPSANRRRTGGGFKARASTTYSPRWSTRICTLRAMG